MAPQTRPVNSPASDKILHWTGVIFPLRFQVSRTECASHYPLFVNPSLKRIILIVSCMAACLIAWLRSGGESRHTPSTQISLPAAAHDPAPSERQESARSTATGVSAFGAFDDWVEKFLAASPSERHTSIDRGISLASARRTALKNLIATNPSEAIARAVPPTIRQQLPRAIFERLEERVNESAFFGVLGALPEPGREAGPAIRRHVRTDDGGNYRAFVFGARSAQMTTERASIVGIAVDDFLAVDESPLRIVTAGEIPNHPANLTQRRTITTLDESGFSKGRQLREASPPKSLVDVCPVSGNETELPESSAPIPPEQPVVEAEGKFQFLCSGGHIHAYRDALVAREGGSGGPAKPLNFPSPTQATGYKSHLLMRVAFPEALRGSVTEKEGYKLGADVEDWFVDSSYGKLSFITTVTPLLILPRSEAWYKDADTSGSAYEVLSDARAAAKAAGFSPSNFDFDTVIYTGTPGGFGGQAYVGGKGCWLKSGTGVGVACHEYGHNFGLWHANFWNTSGASTIGTGSHVEYGDNFDTMGSASAGDLQFNTCHKNMLGWISDSLVHSVKTSGTYRIFQMDQPRQNLSERYALKVRKDNDRDYWVDLRQRSFSANRWVANGVFLHWSPWTASEGGSHLLDTTPGSPDDKTDAPLVIGRTFSDLESGIHITALAKNATVPPSFDVVVNLGTFSGNRPPSLSIAADQTVVAEASIVNFTATASDLDGDALSYWWDFGDKNFATTNSAAVSKSWTTAGTFVVRCVVSDMKGGTASQAIVIKVGASSEFTVAGIVTLDGQPLANVRVHNGLSGSAYRGSFTNTDGRYTIGGLSPASYTIGVALFGYTFSPVTSAGATVGPDVSNIDFTATPSTRISITAIDPVIAEGTSGVLRISRTGSTTSALNVNLLYPSGNANNGSDYTLTPSVAYSDPYYRLTIPAGQSELNVAFNATNDTGLEGSEIAVFEILPGTGYAVEKSTASVTITDGDTTKPLVRLLTIDNDASESGDQARFSVERLGNTSSPLIVNFSIAGAALNGVDFTAGTLSVTIPAGESTANITIQALADSAVEGTESATVTLSTHTSYILPPDAASYSGTFYITDFQTPTVTIIASDAAATESANDPGVFVIARTGDTTLPLTVQLGLTGSALQGVDYSPIPAQITIPAGNESASIVVIPIDDEIGEPAQTVRLYLRAGNSYIIGQQGDATVTISDNNDVPYVTVNTTGVAKEPSTNGTFRITTQGSGTGNITVRYTVSGSATSGVDFTALSGTISIGRNTTANISLIPSADTDVEGYETVTLTLTPDPTYSLAIDSEATIQIEDDDLPIVNASTTDDLPSEFAGSIGKFFISRTGATTAALVVNYEMSGTATPGSDYTAPSGTVTIPAGKTGAYVDISILADTAKEGTESIVLSVSPDSAYSVGISTATHFLDDAQSPSITVGFDAASASFIESAGAATISISLSSPAPSPVSVEVKMNGGTMLGGGIDHAFSPALVTFETGETTKTIAVPLVDNTLPEGSETLILSLDNPAGASLGTSSFTLTITDDDSPPAQTVGFASVASSASESVGTAPIVVVISASQMTPVTVDFSVTGGTATAGDFTINAGTLTFAPGETAKILPNAIIDETTQESSETVVLTLSNPSGLALGANSVHSLTIVDDDTMTLSIATNAQASEPATPGAFTITRSGSTALAVNVNLALAGTATPAADYAEIPAAVSIPAGATSVTIPVTVIDDAIGEPNETVVVSIAPGGYTIGTPASATISISDNEPSVAIIASDATAAEIDQSSATFVITRSGDTSMPLPLSVTISGTALAPEDYAPLEQPIVIPAGSGSTSLLVVPVNDTTPEGNETVVATLETAPGYLVSGSASASATILDDDVNSAPVVTIQSPSVPATTLSEGIGLILEATVVDDGKPLGGTLSITWSKLSGPGDVVFADASQPNTSATFGLAGSYVIRLAAFDGELTATSDVAVTVLAPAAAWTGTNIASASPVGSFSEAPGAITVSGGGSNISGSGDTFFFAHRPLIGNCDFRARVASMSVAGSSAKAGLMIRQATTGNSRGAYVSAASSGSTVASWRTRATDGGVWASSNSSGTPSFPRWVRIVKNGNTFTGFTSTNGSTWSAVGSAGTVSMSEPMLIGFAVTAGSTSTLCTATFDNVSITPLGSVAPLVDAGPGGETSHPQPFALGGSAMDDGLPAPLTTTWQLKSGPGSASFADQTSPTTTVTFSVAGTYILRLVANDTQVKTFSDVSVSSSSSVVNITANTTSATEAAGGVASYTITRNGSGTTPMNVQFATGGSANSADYLDPSGAIGGGAISMAIGETSTVVLAPIVKDALVEGSETLSLSLSETASYSIGAASSATVNIIDAAVLSIVATDSVATELGLTPAAFTISRTGETNEPLSFSLTRGGTATPGVDFANAGTDFTIPAGESGVVISLIPLADQLAEGTETATFSIAEDPAFSLGTTSASAVIEDLPSDAWRLSKFAGDAGNPLIAGDNADPDGDGMINFLEYAFATEPLGTDTPPAITLENGELSLTYRRNLHALDLSFLVQKATLPDTWQPASAVEEVVSENSELRIIRARVSTGSEPAMFLRLRVSRP
jgi:hypothetical protein